MAKINKPYETFYEPKTQRLLNHLNKRTNKQNIYKVDEAKDKIFKVPKKDQEEFRVFLYRDLGIKFTYIEEGQYAVFSFKDKKTRDEAYKGLMVILSGNSLKHRRDSIKKDKLVSEIKEYKKERGIE